MDEMYKQGLSTNQIFIDKQSGKDFDRTNYQKLMKEYETFIEENCKKR